MICISVTPESRRLAKVDILNAARQCDLVEVCLDHLVKEPDVAEMLEGFDTPILVSCRRPEDGGKFKGTEEQRLGLLRQAIVAEPDYIELEFDIADKIPRYGNTKRVVSYTKLNEALGNVDSIYEEAVARKADVVKFTWKTDTIDEAWAMLAAINKKREQPVVGLGVGKSSRMLSILGLRYGAPWTYAALERGMEAHKDQATLFELDEVYDSSHINSKTRFVGLIGFGDREATSVRIFNSGFSQLDLPTRCLPIHLGRTDKVHQMLEVLKINALVVNPELGPKALVLADTVDSAARQGDCADLVFKQADGWHAYNIVWKNALRALEETLGKSSSDERPLDKRNIVVIGAGGLSQAIAYGIQRRQGVLSIAAPDDDEARQIAQMFGVRHIPFSSLYDRLFDVAILADSSLKGGSHRDELNPTIFRPGMTVMDVSRMPEETDLLGEARQRGCKVVEPKDVFIAQVSSQFQSMTGQELPAEAVASVLG
jgi:3-dehydroquinate dehydratase/shikimate dehydrogenase